MAEEPALTEGPCSRVPAAGPDTHVPAAGLAGPIHPRAGELIRALRLQPHAEGGHFAEIYRSPRRVRSAGAGPAALGAAAPADAVAALGAAPEVDREAPGAAPDRSALTTIYFLLARGEVSRWHRLDADETWHFLEGEPLDLLLLGEPAGVLRRERLGPAAPPSVPSPPSASPPSPPSEPVRVVPAGSWLAARPSGAYALVGCTMGPGFEYEGFTLMKDEPGVAAEVARRFPEVADLI